MKLAKHAMNAVEFMTLRDGYRFEQGMTAELSKYELGKTINMPSSVVRSLVRLGCPTELLGFVDARVHEWANND